MHFLTIENLCLAAEAIVVLLLLAFPWGANSKSQKSVASGQIPMDWELVKAAFTQACVFRGLYLQRLVGQSSQPASEELDGKSSYAYHDSHERNAAGETPEPWQDRLTKLINRPGFDQVLRSWMQVGREHRRESSVAMISLTGYSNLLSSHGAMAVENALRAFADKLSGSLGPDSLLARYQAERFIVLAYTQNSSQVHHRMDALQQELSDESFFRSGEISFGLESIVSIAALGEENEVDQIVNQLDEGYLNADDRGCTIVSLQEGEWEDCPAFDADPSTRDQKNKADRQALSDKESATQEIDGEGDLNDAPLENAIDDSKAANTLNDAEEAEDQVAESVKQVESVAAAHDISAVANPEDIEALFAEIRAKKAKTSESQTPSPVSKAPSSAASGAVSKSDKASSDDIAALFAANQPKKPTTPKATTTSGPEPQTTVTPTVQPSLNEAASADDIAALFAANAPKQNAAQPNPANQAAKQEEMPAIDPTEAATADDIAALFATVKQATAPTKAAPTKPSEPEKPVAPPAQPANPSGEELNQAASSDDIAALFATVKPATTAMETTVQDERVDQASALTGDQLAGAATADDIAALFASVQPKPPVQPANANPGTTVAKPVSKPTETDEPKIPTGEELQNAASADDIAALFAAMKK